MDAATAANRPSGPASDRGGGLHGSSRSGNRTGLDFHAPPLGRADRPGAVALAGSRAKPRPPGSTGAADFGRRKHAVRSGLAENRRLTLNKGTRSIDLRVT